MMFEELLTGRNVSLAGAIFVCLSLAKRMAPDFFAGRVGQRILPVLPIVLGELGAFVGLSDAATWQDKLLVGLIAGWAAGNVFKVGRTSVLGYGLPGVPGADEDSSTVAPPVVPPVASAPVVTAPATEAAPVAEKKE